MDALASESDSWRILWVRADSGWNTALENIEGLNEALAAEVRATEAWKRAAKPSLGTKVLEALPPLAIGGALCYAFCPGRE